MNTVNLDHESYMEIVRKAVAFDAIKASIEENARNKRTNYNFYPEVNDDLVRILTDTNHKVPAEQDELANE